MSGLGHYGVSFSYSEIIASLGVSSWAVWQAREGKKELTKREMQSRIIFLPRMLFMIEKQGMFAFSLSVDIDFLSLREGINFESHCG